MYNGKPIYLTICIAICNLLSYITAGIHYLLIAIKLLNSPLYLKNTTTEKFQFLHFIWYTRFVKRIVSALVQSPLRQSTLRLVNFNIQFPEDSGCIIAICHTPWRRLLVQVCYEKEIGLIISNTKLKTKKNIIQKRGIGTRDLREIIRHLQQKDKIILSVDVFNNINNCPVEFLGKIKNASLFPLRISKLAGVPLIVVLPTLHNGSISFIQGPQFNATLNEENFSDLTQDIFKFLNKEIQNNPSILESYVV